MLQTSAVAQPLVQRRIQRRVDKVRIPVAQRQSLRLNVSMLSKEYAGHLTLAILSQFDAPEKHRDCPVKALQNLQFSSFYIEREKVHVLQARHSDHITQRAAWNYKVASKTMPLRAPNFHVLR